MLTRCLSLKWHVCLSIIGFSGIWDAADFLFLVDNRDYQVNLL